jgi:hypothetical protein
MPEAQKLKSNCLMDQQQLNKKMEKIAFMFLTLK